MNGYLCLILHAHLPFVRHPEHERFLEESWLFEAITETYVPLLRLLETWRREAILSELTLVLTPTLCSMLQDPLLQTRYRRYLDQRIELVEKEILRTVLETPLQRVALFYRQRLGEIRQGYESCGGNLVQSFRKAQDLGQIEIATCAATHALLPLLAAHPPSLAAQVRVACDHYQACFGRVPRGIWLPECAYALEIEPVLQAANLRWFIADSHGLLHAQPQPRYGLFAPIFTPRGIAVFGRDRDSAKQVWSREEGYPGEPCYRDFYRDIGFDLDFDYIEPYLPSPGLRGFTGIKYHRITGPSAAKELYDPSQGLDAARGHARDFLGKRTAQVRRLAEILQRPPVVVAPYDAELFGHWWFEGPEFLDQLVRSVAEQDELTLSSPEGYLLQHPTQQVAAPAPSSWGERGYWEVWLNEKNEWIQRHLHAAQDQMTALAQAFPQPGELQQRALRQAARELLLAQASDWPFILRTGTSADYARRRVQEHLERFAWLREQLLGPSMNEQGLARIENADNLFPEIDYRYWAASAGIH